jgi:hypothetical protein
MTKKIETDPLTEAENAARAFARGKAFAITCILAGAMRDACDEDTGAEGMLMTETMRSIGTLLSCLFEDTETPKKARREILDLLTKEMKVFGLKTPPDEIRQVARAMIDIADGKHPGQDGGEDAAIN